MKFDTKNRLLKQKLIIPLKNISQLGKNWRIVFTHIFGQVNFKHTLKIYLSRFEKGRLCNVNDVKVSNYAR